jgi:MYXO-CTERM domain-containing protein
MKPDVRFALPALLLLVSCGQLTAEEEAALRAPGQHYQPAPVYGTTCDCQPIHGTCDQANGACDLKCDANFADCNGKKSDGCETSLETTFDCGSCGNDCNGCFRNATCTAGKCGGQAERDGTACNAAAPCGVAGFCQNAVCICSDKIDMSGGAPDLLVGPDLSAGGGKDMAGGGMAPGGCGCAVGAPDHAPVWLLGLGGIAAALFLARRRRS